MIADLALLENKALSDLRRSDFAFAVMAACIKAVALEKARSFCIALESRIFCPAHKATANTFSQGALAMISCKSKCDTCRSMRLGKLPKAESHASLPLEKAETAFCKPLQVRS